MVVKFVTGGLLVMIHDDVLRYQTWPGAAFTQPGSQIISTRGSVRRELSILPVYIHLNLNSLYDLDKISWESSDICYLSLIRFEES